MENNIEASEEQDIKVILSYVKGFLKTRKFIFTMVLLFLVLGIISTFFTQKTYSSQVTFIAQGSTGPKVSGLSAITKLLSGGGAATQEISDLPTFLYPHILESLSFKRKLYNTQINLRGRDSSMTFKEYALQVEKPPFKSYLLKYTLGLPKLIFGSKKTGTASIKIDSLEYISSEESRAFQSLKEKVVFLINEEDGSLNITGTMVNEPLAAAQLTQSAHQILEAEIIRFRLAKSQEKYDFLAEQTRQKREQFEQAQQRLASYNDRNLYNKTQSSLIRRSQLENESSLYYTIYSDLEQQLLGQSIKIQEDTPTFTVMNEAIVPTQPDDDDSILMVLIFGFIGFFIAVLRYLYIVTKQSLKSLWNQVD